MASAAQLPAPLHALAARTQLACEPGVPLVIGAAGGAVASAYTAGHVAQSYARFAAWVGGSLATVRHELRELSAALLLYTVIELLLLDEEDVGGDARVADGPAVDADGGGGGGAVGDAAPRTAAAAARALIAGFMASDDCSGTRLRDELAALSAAAGAIALPVAGARRGPARALVPLASHRLAPGAAAAPGTPLPTAGATFPRAAAERALPPTLGGGWSAGGSAADGDVLARLLAPGARVRVPLSPTGVALALEFLTRHRSLFLLGALNERVAVVPLPAAAAAGGAGGAALVLPYPGGVDAVAGSLRVTDRLGNKAKHLVGGGAGAVASLQYPVRWGVLPLRRARAGEPAPYTGARAASAFTATPWPDYVTTPYGRAVASAAVDAAADGGGAAGAEAAAGAADGASAGAASPPTLTCLTASAGGGDVGDAAHARPPAGDAPVAVASSAVVTCAAVVERWADARAARGGDGVARVAALGFCDGRVRVYVTVLPPRAGDDASPPPPAITLVLTASDAAGRASRATYGVAVSPCGRFVLAACGDGCARLFGLAPAVARGTSAALASRAAGGLPAAAPPGMARWAAVVGAPPAGSAPAAGGAPPDTLHPLAAYAHSPALPVWAVAFHPFHPSLFATAGRDGTAQVWTTAAPGGAPALVLAGHGCDVTAVAFTANGMYVASGGADGCVRLWDVGGAGECVRVLRQRHTGAVVSLAPSPGGRWLASGDDAGDVVLWDAAAGPAAVLRAAAGGVPGRRGRSGAGAPAAAHAAVAWDAGGRRVACGSPGGAVAVWDAAAILDRYDARAAAQRPGSFGAPLEPAELLPAPSAVPDADGTPGPLLLCASTATAAFALSFADRGVGIGGGLTVVGPVAQ